MNVLRKLLMLVPLLSALVATAPASAQQDPRISGFDLEQVDQLSPGTELNFILYGTPRSRAALNIEGAQHDLVLSEAQPGVYRGVYTVSRRDKLLPSSTVTANLRSGNRVASAVLDEPLLAGWTPPAPAGAMPRIERLDFLPSTASANAPALQMVLYGSPGGRATARIAGTPGRVMLDETRPGEYRGSYPMRPDERLNSGTEVVANLRVDDRRVSTTFTLPVSASGMPPRDVRPVAGAGWCPDCGTVVAVNRVEVNGDGNYVGAVAGGLVGAVIGNQVGKGDGRTAAQIAGALGGALAGREIQRRSNRTEHYEVVVDMRGGGQQTVSFNSPPELAVGDRVRLANGTLVRDR